MALPPYTCYLGGWAGEVLEEYVALAHSSSPTHTDIPPRSSHSSSSKYHRQRVIPHCSWINRKHTHRSVSLPERHQPPCFSVPWVWRTTPTGVVGGGRLFTPLSCPALSVCVSCCPDVQ